MDLLLKGKVIFVTASTSGIGNATAKAFLEEGSIVIINGRQKEKLNECVIRWRQIYGENRVFGIVRDLSDEEEISKAYNEIKKMTDHIDVLVSNVGTGKPMGKDKLNSKEWEYMLTTNLLSSVHLLRQFSDFFTKDRGGSIVLLSSLAAYDRLSAPPAYAAAKAGINTLIEYLAKEYTKDQIRINGVAPGNILFEGGRWDELKREDPEGTADYIQREVPMNRFGTTEEIAAAVVFLASEKSGFTTGTVLNIDGGQRKGY